MYDKVRKKNDESGAIAQCIKAQSNVTANPQKPRKSQVCTVSVCHPSAPTAVTERQETLQMLVAC